LAVRYRTLDPEGSIVGGVSVVEPIQVPSDADGDQVDEELRSALQADDAVRSIRVETREVTRRREHRDSKVPALDVPVVEEVLRVAVDAVRDEAAGVVLSVTLGELLNRAIAAIKGRGRPSTRDPFPPGSLFQVAPGILSEASALIDVPPGALAAERVVGSTQRVDIHARLLVGAGGYWHVWGTKDGEIGAEKISAAKWRALFD
jgi:hypothetical protein